MNANALLATSVLVLLFNTALAQQSSGNADRQLPKAAKEYPGVWVKNTEDGNCTDWHRQPVQTIQQRAIRFQTTTHCNSPVFGDGATQTLAQYYVDCPSGQQVIEFIKFYDRSGRLVDENSNLYSGEDAFTGALKDRSKAKDAMAVLGLPVKHVPAYHQHIFEQYCPK